ncbi:unnamed protein product [Auanema sp. JU1783]|nr:unnamed protein product [Auanema sp. JU1783]
MMEDKESEKEKLLPAGELPRASSTRFQVSRLPRSDGEDESGTEVPDCKEDMKRNYSSTGRFMVTCENETGSNPSLHQKSESPDCDDDELDELGSKPTLIKSKGVHFSVGDNEGKRESSENHTTLNMKSWRNMKTIEHPPIMDFYRNSVDVEFTSSRPSMAQLIHGEKHATEDMAFEDFKIHNSELVEGHSSVELRSKVEKFNPPTQQARSKFGWVEGVFVRCLLNIFGVMLYLRISWVAGQAGIGLGCAIVLLASFVTFITAVSTCAICTNGDVKGGGAYFLISRSLGPEFGGSIGLIFSVANAVGAAMYVVGFAETVRDLLKENDMSIIDGDIWDVRIIGFASCILLVAIVFIGTSFESKMQLGLLVILLLSIVDYVIGSFFTPTDEMMRRGATGYSLDTFKENFLPSFRNEDFFSVFSVYFPAATGIMAGANISGDLADPQKAIPIGTLLAIASTTVIYLFIVVMTGSTNVRDSDGLSYPMWNGSSFLPPDCVANDTCGYGLMNYFQVVEMESAWGPLITAGIFAATLSSALASLVSAPKVFQAVCKDRLFPKIGYFAKSYGADEEPRRAYILSFIIAFSMVGIGDLNAIAPIISNFFLASYTLINYACFDQSFADSPGFRPSFKYYNMWVSLFGSILCIIVMFVISWVTALITFLCFAAIFLYLLHRKPEVNWGSSTQAHSYKTALAGMIKLANTEEHIKNFRPQFLVLTGNPAARPSLVDFVYNITKGTSLMVCGYVVPYHPSDRVFSVIKKLDLQLNEWLKKRKVKSFYTSIANASLRAGAQSLLSVVGLGRLKPNIVFIGFKCNWYMGGPTEDRLHELTEYFGTIQDAFDNGLGVCVLRNGDMGLDFSEAMKMLNVGESSRFKLPEVNRVEDKCEEKAQEEDKNGNNEKSNGQILTINETEGSSTLQHKDSARSMEQFARMSNHYIEASNSLTDNFPFEEDEENHENEGEEEEEAVPTEGEDLESGQPNVSDDIKKQHTFSLRRRNSRRPTMEQKALLASICRFQRKVVKNGTIDVWWLYDDGGLTLLIPHLLTIPKSYLEGSKLRVFTISTSSRTMEQEQRGMAALLSKFRIDFSDVSVIADIGKKPMSDTMERWEKLIAPWVAPDGECPNGMTSKSELDAQKEKTWRQLRAAELLKKHSSNADLIVMTLPVPRKGLVSAALYMSWLDIMTRGLPPTLFVRGNQTSVLTFYS